jgi:hypothetical protein
MIHHGAWRFIVALCQCCVRGADDKEPSVHAIPTAGRCPSPPATSVGERSDIENFNYYANRIRGMIKSLSISSTEVREALEQLQTRFPVPPSEIVPQDVWEVDAYLLVKTHLTSDFEDAVSNVNSSGHELTTAEENYLRLILKHWCRWSPTAVSHMRDPWVRYLQSEFSHLPGLVPILDSVVWLEELDHLPRGFDGPQGSLFLLGTSDSYFIFHLEDGQLLRAGVTLKDVYEGLKECRFQGGEEDDWPSEPKQLQWNWRKYFPIYGRRRGDGKWEVERPMEEFIERVPATGGDEKSVNNK